ncbi:hypothetical protein ACVWWJ_004213 [Luteibacter sp. HA06]
MHRGIDRDRTSVFINCPFTADFRQLHEAMIFTVLACRFRPRSALEAGNSGDVRLDKIVRLMKESEFSVHDLSAVGLDAASGLPRFNMPFELGIAVGLKKATRTYASHSLLILEHEKYASQKCLSDIAGQDLQAHGWDTARLIPIVRNWLRTESRRTDIPGGTRIIIEYANFNANLPRMCIRADLDRDALPFVDLVALAQTWLQQARSRPTARPARPSSAACGTSARRTA